MVVDRRLSSSLFSLIPEDILAQIVGRISCIKTILRCTSVCKSWYSFITSTQFVKFHDDDDKNINIDKRRLLCQYMEWGKGYCFSIHDDSENFHKHYSYTHNNKLILEGNACHGLICYMNRHHDSLYLWNPVIRKVKKLPDIEYDSVSNHDHIYKYPVFKLWFDSNANDYKILIAYTNTTNTCSVHVYSLNTNSWKLITPDVDRVYTHNMDELVHVNGTLYWPAHKDGKWILVSLDTRSWMFREIPTRFQAWRLYLAPSNHDDSLVILRCPNIEADFFFNPNSNIGCSVFDVYKYTTNELYSLIIGNDGRIDLHLPLAVKHNNDILYRVPVGVRHNDDLLFKTFKSLNTSSIDSYNMKTKKLVEFFDSTRIHDHIVRVTPFVQTLALLDDTDAYGI